MLPLNLFYEEPDPDRWLPLDRYPRRLVRRLLRPPRRPGGQTRVYLNLRAGLDRLKVPYRVNDYRHAKRHPEEIACIIGKPHVLDKAPWRNRIIFGAAVYSHPCDDPRLLERLPVRRILVPGEWMRRMWQDAYGEKVEVWPVGIDTDSWHPSTMAPKNIDFLLYDKIMWERNRHEAELLQPLRLALKKRNLKTAVLRYGFYREEEFHQLLGRCRAMVFLCEHETQGLAYQQCLSCGVPILAWDCKGFWQDPAYYPHKVRYQPVSSVPYWDHRCGLTFANTLDFPARLDEFLAKLASGGFAPRDYILENLTLERCAQRYVDIVRGVEQEEFVAAQTSPRRP